MSTKIESIDIAGFKSIAKDRPLHLTLGDVNILLGPNGAGKSNIISFFRMLNFMMSGTLQNFVATNGTNQAFLYFGAKVTPSIAATIRLRGSLTHVDSDDWLELNAVEELVKRQIETGAEIVTADF